MKLYPLHVIRVATANVRKTVKNRTVVEGRDSYIVRMRKKTQVLQ